MLHDNSGIKISNLEELALALDSKLDRVNITNEASTEITIPGNLPQSEIQNRGEWKVPSQKAFLTFYITVNGNKVSYGDISHVYKGLYKKGELEYEFNGRNIEADLKVKTAY